MSSYKVRKTPGDTSWFMNDRFGMFIHFGLYSMGARVEWFKSYECVSEEHYQKYFDHFNPDLFDPKDWAKKAKAAGMKYVVLTTKHHEGFCLFDSKYTDYKVTNTAYGKDLVREFVDAFRAEGIHIGFYYSLIDWHHPEFPIDCHHPRRHDADAEEQDKGRDMSKYCEYMRNQVTELLTNYGKIDILWFDFSYPDPIKIDLLKNEVKPWMQYKGGKDAPEWEAEALIETARKLQPNVIIDNRTGLDQDIWTPEQRQPLEWVTDPKTGELLPWEACHTFSGSWSYAREERSWKSPKMLIEILVNTVSIGGNVIMNVGPTSRGLFDKRANAALEVYAEWMKYHSRSVYGCTMAEPEFKAPRGTRLTQSADGKRLYIHLVEYPFAYLEMEFPPGVVDYAQFLNDGSEVFFSEGCMEHMGTIEEKPGLVVFNIPTVQPDAVVPVIEVFLK